MTSGTDFERFYEFEYVGQVRRAWLILGSEDDARDVVHDAFAAVWDRWDSIREPGAYLNRVVLNPCRERGRQRSRRRRLMRRLRPDENTVEWDPLDDVLEVLPVQQRMAVVLRFYEGCSISEIAEAMDAPMGSIGPWLSRAMATLRKELT